MWIGEGEFDSYGYQKVAFIKGEAKFLAPDQCYRIFDWGPAHSAEQYHFVPVDADGNETGPSVLNTDGRSVYMIWEAGLASPAYNISNEFIS
ncbi:hypothetical protein [Roseibium suaedae]|uniref:Uncharacterized protein n=1 Tax=Roseibium suaedae TaxID=735517 RepID=A0A1M7GEX2_9HYPH|nr:hypothetical protein [Roseibium suaedae]SHM14675.1 hypothetical protein SAMN05444272_1901 [Roseibium suaedae]